jgi:hypothetical protein
MDGNLVGRRRLPVSETVHVRDCLGSKVRNRQLVVLNYPTRTGLSYVSMK